MDLGRTPSSVWSIKMLAIQYILLPISDIARPTSSDTKIQFYQSLLWFFIHTLSAIFSVRRLALHSK